MALPTPVDTRHQLSATSTGRSEIWSNQYENPPVHPWNGEPDLRDRHLQEGLQFGQPQRMLADLGIGSLADQGVKVPLDLVELGDISTQAGRERSQQVLVITALSDINRLLVLRVTSGAPRAYAHQQLHDVLSRAAVRRLCRTVYSD